MKHDDVEPYLGLMLVESLCYVPSYVEKTHVLIMSSHCKMCIMFEKLCNSRYVRFDSNFRI